jgi:hypothetical protein
LAVLVWLLAIAVPCVRVAAEPGEHSVYPAYVFAGRGWNAGRDMYAHSGYRYSPLVATFFSFFAPLPDNVGAPLWHLLNGLVFVGALAVWQRRFVPASDRRSWMLFFLVALPPSLASLNNGQANALVLGLMLLAMNAVCDERWHGAALCIALAGAFKVYPLLLGAVLITHYPRQLGPRLAVWGLVALALPFLLQQPDYVLQQYQSWFTELRHDDRQVLPLPLAYRDLRLMLRTCGTPISQSAYFGAQMLAVGVLVGFAARRRTSQTNDLALLFTLSMLWMTVLGPATEACTYILLAPALAFAALQARREAWPPTRCTAFAVAYVLVTYPQLPFRLPGAGTLANHAAQCVGALLLAATLIDTNRWWRLAYIHRRREPFSAAARHSMFRS